MILAILWSRCKVDVSNGVYNITYLNFLKDVLTLILYTPLNIPTQNLNSRNGEDAIQICCLFPPFWSILRKRTFLGKVVLEPLVVLAIVINHVILPHPSEPPSLYRC